jgi:hypothetical protein
MTDNTNDSKKDSTAPGDPLAAKRPYATLDLKATEIKVTSLGDKGTAAPGSTPRPAVASSYASADAARSDTGAKPEATMQTSSTQSPSTAKAAATAATAPVAEKVVIKKRGGFFSHMTAGIIGGVLALAASEWALPQLGIQGTTSRLADNTSALEQRLKALEKTSASSDTGKSLAATEERLAALEKTAQSIPALSEGQSRLVAETKAALAAAASDAGDTDLIERLGKIETQMKALADAGANDPASGRLAQLAALTGKVADLETSRS